jgi:isoquinoline 1-oxidoreductase beta subunit
MYIVESTEKPGGIGEPGMALLGPTMANALYALTGQRYRKMPFTAAA